MTNSYLIRVQLHEASSSDYQALYKRLAATGFSAAIELGPPLYNGPYAGLYSALKASPYDGNWELPNAEYFCQGPSLTGDVVLKAVQGVVQTALNEELSALNESIKAAGEEAKILITQIVGVVHSGLKRIPANAEPLT